MNWAQRGIVLLVATAIGILLLVRGAQHDTYGGVKVDRITEDDVRWDCRTMGNGVCGNE
jgi:hypothetical protein